MRECAKEMWNLRIGSIMCRDSHTGEVAGIVTERDFVNALATTNSFQGSSLLVRDVMTPASKIQW